MQSNAVFNGAPKVDEVVLPDGGRINLSDGLRVCSRAIIPEYLQISKSLHKYFPFYRFQAWPFSAATRIYWRVAFSLNVSSAEAYQMWPILTKVFIFITLNELKNPPECISSIKDAFMDIRQNRKIWSTRATHRNMRLSSFTQAGLYPLSDKKPKMC